MSNNSNYAAKRLMQYVWRYKWRFIYGVLAGALVGLSIFGMLNSMEQFFDPQGAAEAAASGNADTLDMVLNWLGIEKTNPDGTVTAAFTAVIVLTVPFFMALKGLFTFLNAYCMRWVGTRTIADIRNDLFKNLTGQSLKFYSKSEVGKLISRVFNDTGLAEHLISSSVADLTRGPVEILACLGFIVYYAVEKGFYSVPIAFIIGAPLILFPIILLGRRLKRVSRKSLEYISTVSSHMMETMTGIRVVKAYHMEQAETDRFVRHNDDYVAKVVSGIKYEILITPVMEVVGGVLICAFLVYAYMNGLRFNEIAPFGMAAALAYQPMKRIGKVVGQIQRSLIGAERAFELIDMKADLVETEGAVAIDAFNDAVVFDHVDFRYDAEGPKIVDDLTLEIKKGEMVAFVGETGSGKTTISNLLARFYDPTAGRILIDGQDLRDLKIESLRHLIGVVTQDTVIFNDTIAYNIGYGSADVTEAMLVDAAKKANAHEFIMEKPEGYATICGEKGFNLSGGQKQRLSIARAILKNPPILILDEATSALDTVTEQLVQEALNNLMGSRTVFAIAHRLSTIKHADKICVLDKGQIVEIGSHDELYAQNGRYRKLCDMQFS